MYSVVVRFQAAETDSSSDSDSDADDDDYETICLHCQASAQHPFGHVFSDVTRSTSGTTSERISGSAADKPETETTKGLTVISRNRSELDQDRVLVVWGSYKPEVPEPEIDEVADHVTQSVSVMLPCVEEVHV